MPNDPADAAPPQRVLGKVALVAGAASGIGAACARLLARHGAAVVCADVATDGATATAAAITDAGGRASARALDVTDEGAWEAALAHAADAYGALDVVVNSAGISFARPLEEMTLAEWRRVMAVNLDGAFLGTRAAVAALHARGGAGSVINISSASGIKAAPGAAAYSASKAGVAMLTRVAAKECVNAGLRVRVNCVSPAGVRTPMWTAMPFFRDLVERTGSEEGAWAALAESSPFGRFATADEVAHAVLYLASDESAYVTGTDLVVDGGFTV
jgi:3(or 17)beta-hydroxysteroid dehydrogenase